MSRARQLRIRDMIVQLARETGAYRIEVDADESPQLFGSDSFHLNQEGHRWVAEQMWAVYKRLPCAPRQLTRAGAGRAGLDNVNRGELYRSATEGSTMCLVGEELLAVVSANATAGFHHVDLNPPEKKTPKMVWEARKPGATLSLCLPMALGVAAQRAERSKAMVEVRGRNMTLPDKQFRLGLGLIMSHAANLPLFGVARVDCAGACKCSCEVADGADCLVDTLSNGTRVTVTDYTRVLIVPRALSAAGAGKADRVGRMCGEGADPTAMCIVRVRNTRVQGARARVAVRSLTFGINDYRTNFKLAASVRRA